MKNWRECLHAPYFSQEDLQKLCDECGVTLRITPRMYIAEVVKKYPVLKSVSRETGYKNYPVTFESEKINVVLGGNYFAPKDTSTAFMANVVLAKLLGEIQ